MNLKETLKYMTEADNSQETQSESTTPEKSQTKNQNQKVDNTKENIKKLNEFIKAFDGRINNVKKYFQALNLLEPNFKNDPNSLKLIQSLKDSMTKIVNAYGDDKKGFKANSLKFLNSLENPSNEDAKKAQRNTSDALRKYKNSSQQNQNSEQDQNGSQQNNSQQSAENSNESGQEKSKN
jgi:hypothetical protein